MYTALVPAPDDQVLVLTGGTPVLTAKALERFFDRGVQGDAVEPRVAEALDE